MAGELGLSLPQHHGTEPVTVAWEQRQLWAQPGRLGLLGALGRDRLLPRSTCLLSSLQSIDPGQQFTWENSNLEVNKPKNRYANVIAYDHSRVILTSIDGEPRAGPPRILWLSSSSFLLGDIFSSGRGPLTRLEAPR